GRSGLDLLRDLRERRFKLPVLVLSMHSEEQYAHRAFKAGASGYVSKASPGEELVRAIERVMAGGKYVNAATAERLAQELAMGSKSPPHEALSDREFEVLRQLGSGMSVREIADLLKLSDKTVSTYRTRILEKLRMKTNAEIIRYAIRNNLVG